MSRPRSPLRLSFQDAMSIHVLRARGLLYRDLTEILGEHPSVIVRVLDGELHPGSWESAVESIAAGRHWSLEIGLAVEQAGETEILASLNRLSPARRRFERQVKQARRWSLPARPGLLRGSR